MQRCSSVEGQRHARRPNSNAAEATFKINIEKAWKALTLF